MKRSESRILTTHTGSLPRPAGLVAMLGAVSRGEPVDEAAMAEAAQSATVGVVRAQAEAGVDVINGGEQSRISFSTYVTQRMSGFGGAWTRRGQRDQNEFPSVLRPRVVNLMSDVPMCVAPLSYDRLDIAQQECDGLLNAVAGSGVAHEELFMTAASPGIITLTMKNGHYGAYEDYVYAAAEEMRKEYELVVSKGLILQLDCPDLAMERHITYQDEPLEAFQSVVELHVDAINRALVNIPRDRVRLHVCWGNSEGPHHHDVPLEDILPIIYRANVGSAGDGDGQPAPRPRASRLPRLPAARRDAAGGRGHRHQDQLRGASPAGGRPAAPSRGRRGRRPHPRAGWHRLRLRHLRRFQPGGRRRGLAQAAGHARGRGHRQPGTLLARPGRPQPFQPASRASVTPGNRGSSLARGDDV